MNHSRHFSSLAIVAGLLMALFAMIFVSCRTSRQESRRPSTQSNGKSGSQAMLGRQMDSLLIIEEKLLDVIDSMTGLVSADHARIRDLEQQVREMQSRVYGTPLPPATSYNDSPYGSSGSPPPAVPEPVTAPASTAPSSLQERYETALNTFNDNNFEAALSEFQSLERDDPDGSYASNYKYWEGECYYAEQRYSVALQTFTNTLSKYPNSTKAAATQFKIAECYDKLNSLASARAAYERVISDYPSSEFSARAQARLKTLR